MTFIFLTIIVLPPRLGIYMIVSYLIHTKAYSSNVYNLPTPCLALQRLALGLIHLAAKGVEKTTNDLSLSLSRKGRKNNDLRIWSFEGLKTDCLRLVLYSSRPLQGCKLYMTMSH